MKAKYFIPCSLKNYKYLLNKVSSKPIYSVFHSYEVHLIFDLFHLPFSLLPAPCFPAPCSLLPAPCSLLPKTQRFVPDGYK
ncbi:MAG: hypothetical protein F6K65_03575 [Moorea sp. SIO3C2]|nr:hypothetical protein [Moorena sp. SIO3C2]